ncbi:MAG: GNAT family N-acetyltransferase [Oscillospiraceae bacterium]|nr:GNAT family N-acetyltransferase [Oscillospiraceae bacterium]
MTREEAGQIICQMSGDFHADAVWLETERLILRPLNREDLWDLHALRTQPEVARMAGWQVSDNLEATEKWLQESICDGENLAVVLKETGRMVGTLSLQKRPWHIYPIDRNLRGRELGCDLGKEYWGRGLMPEALKALCRFCFETLHYDFLTAGHFVGNRQSRRVIEKCGFTMLFEDDRRLPSGQTVHLCTYILERR